MIKIKEKNGKAINKIWRENANDGGPWKNDEDFELWWCTTKLENITKFCEVKEINWQDNYTLGEFARLEFVILIDWKQFARHSISNFLSLWGRVRLSPQTSKTSESIASLSLAKSHDGSLLPWQNIDDHRKFADN